MDIKEKKILVIGSARSGLGAAKLANQLGADVCVYDQKVFEVLSSDTQDYINQLKGSQVSFALGQDVAVDEFDLVIVSPGVPLEIPLIQEAVAKGKTVLGEFEFASRYCKAPILGITGTNGKTTTTALVGQIVKAYNPQTYIVGNIGRAFSEEVLDIPVDGVVVAEMSSFQLETIQELHAQVGALLNITPDHLNRHKTMENYCKAKYRLFENQVADDFAILNAKDEYYEDAKQYISSQLITFNLDSEVTRGAYVQGDSLYENITGTTRYICKKDELKILGDHNVENALAAIAITTAFGVSTDMIRRELLNFNGVEHRIEYVGTKKGVDLFNDSKATNTDAAIKGLISMRKPIRLLGGGMDKKTSFKDWIQLFEGRVVKAYVIGETKEQIIRECQEESFMAVEAFETFEEAIKAAYDESQSGECILLSPACASWDMFESYEQRGEIFKTIVMNLEG